MKKSFYEYESKVQSFHHNNEPEIIHVIKMGSTNVPNKYIVVYDDTYQITTSNTEILTKEQIERKFNIRLTI